MVFMVNTRLKLIIIFSRSICMTKYCITFNNSMKNQSISIFKRPLLLLYLNTDLLVCLFYFLVKTSKNNSTKKYILLQIIRHDITLTIMYYLYYKILIAIRAKTIMCRLLTVYSYKTYDYTHCTLAFRKRKIVFFSSYYRITNLKNKRVVFF